MDRSGTWQKNVSRKKNFDEYTVRSFYRGGGSDGVTESI